MRSAVHHAVRFQVKFRWNWT